MQNIADRFILCIGPALDLHECICLFVAVRVCLFFEK